MRASKAGVARGYMALLQNGLDSYRAITHIRPVRKELTPPGWEEMHSHVARATEPATARA